MAKEEGCRLYLISPPKFELVSFTDQFKRALEGGDVAAFQLRLKDTVDEEILKAAEALVPLCHDAGVAFIMNDRADLAIECGADGVHVGQEDLEKTSFADLPTQLGENAEIGIC